MKKCIEKKTVVVLSCQAVCYLTTPTTPSFPHLLQFTSQQDSSGNVRLETSLTSQNAPHSIKSSAGKPKSSSSLLHDGVKTFRTTSHPIPLSATIKKQSSKSIPPDDITGPRGVRATRFVPSIVAGLERMIQAADEPKNSTPQKVSPIAHAEVVEVQAENTKHAELDDTSVPVESVVLYPIINATTRSEIHFPQFVECITASPPIAIRTLCGVVSPRTVE
ncbi:hypothetical protein DFS34DRAFT_494577 [Phlyctochytrium arcticum]|nr:hypothetical protein DFS34DRAFT_494577 [Phlyctochytrium arcticum]